MSRPESYDVKVRVLRGGQWLVLEWEGEYGERETAGLPGPLDGKGRPGQEPMRVVEPSEAFEAARGLVDHG